MFSLGMNGVPEGTLVCFTDGSNTENTSGAGDYSTQLGMSLGSHTSVLQSEIIAIIEYYVSVN